MPRLVDHSDGELSFPPVLNKNRRKGKACQRKSPASFLSNTTLLLYLHLDDDVLKELRQFCARRLGMRLAVHR